MNDLLKKAWKVRLNNFPRLIKFVKPKKTLAVSLTGSKCELNCPHCEGHYLKNMKPLDKDKTNNIDINYIIGNYESCLISGGSDKNGKVPFYENEKLIKDLSNKNIKTNLHPGLVSEAEAKKVSLVDVCSVDFIVDEDIIKNLYGLEKTKQDFLDSYNLLSKYAKVIVPHIIIGLPGGEARMEEKSLNVLKNLRADAITFIVFTPTKDTSYQNCDPPDLSYVGEVISLTRIKFPQHPIFLGCMRPGGKYREELDKIAFWAGVNKIVSPTPAIRNLAVEEGFEINWEKECCSL
ncbi:hypothetical protein [Natranaerofaba carboxydovora]|uniref:hypothetical protein n=1 Tax=Natranaerofaba carboxydovora TaxID=2742683 RepID=UPI001F12FED1|nr:hypothetical protein [Natranaerofaba carboxydovora]UMZ73971.1 hypothetical protein ACONDI_01541 [Natranaerofaba carboxydovora]